jgi:hypothetical protein
MNKTPLAVVTRTHALTANKNIIDNVRGRVLHIMELSGSIKLSIGERTPSVVQRGDRFSLPEGEIFDKVEIIEYAGSTGSITFRVGEGDISNTATQISSAITTNDGDTGAYGAVTVGTSAVQISAANTSKNSVLITNTDSSTFLYVGTDNLVTTATGTPVLPNSSIEVRTGGAVWGIAASSIGTRYLETRD